MDELRVRLIERLCRLPDANLGDVEALLDRLAGHVSPASDSPQPTLGQRDWPHAPLHRLSEQGTFIVTASTVHKQHLFRGDDNLTLLETELLRLAKQFGVALEAWAVFSNHYHIVAHTSGVENQLASFLTELHSVTATALNRDDSMPGRQVWFNYWETKLTFERSYFARLNYVHHNAVKHGLVRAANEYRWCSAAWFERTASPAQVKTIYGFKYDRIEIDDDYNPIWSAAI